MKRKLAVTLTTALTTAASAMYCAMSAFASEAADQAADSTQKTANPLLTFVVPLGLFFVLLYFMLIRPQKKREQEQKDLQSSIQVGDEVITTGGVVGLVVRVAEDTVVIETGGERTKLRMKNWAIAENVSAKERAKAAAPKKKSALAQAGLSEEKKPEKKSKKKNDSEE
jgi:preprotein translocase subunit YajC